VKKIADGTAYTRSDRAIDEVPQPGAGPFTAEMTTLSVLMRASWMAEMFSMNSEEMVAPVEGSWLMGSRRSSPAV
jgi:hypothetical protein